MEIIGVGILLLVLIAGFVIFFIGRKVMKMAVRLVIAGVVLLIVIVGAVSLWYFNSSGGGDNHPSPTRKSR
jgi:asparagine N-glycosylation enzyme membrane subunit Stt3